MNRPLFAWSIFGICLLAATSAVGWLTLSAWRADQARQQALLDSEIRNALWRMDSLVAPLLAIEINRPSLAVPFTGTPMLAPKLVNGYVVRDASGSWTIQQPRSAACEPLPADSPFISENWTQRLGTGGSVSDITAELASADSLPVAPIDDLILWPEAIPPVPAGQTGPGGRSARYVSGGQEVQNRNQVVQQLTQAAANSYLPIEERRRASAGLGPLRPLWVGSELVLARQTPAAAKSAATVVEVCWLNWKEWETLLAAQLAGTSVPLRLQPCEVNMAVSGDAPAEEWRMASLPIRLEPQSNHRQNPWPFPLISVWGLLLIVALAFGCLMRQTLALSERRAAFVSAVTHELRTPLTTFRLYSEMLSEGVASDPQQQQTYFQTLNREANRLTHLVENVLAYARLEHGRSSARNETVTVGELIDRCRPRMEQRVAETPFTLSFEVSDSARSATLTTNALAVEQVLFNLIDNSCKYARDAADLRIVCDVQIDGGHVSIRVADFGPGLSAAARSTLFQPFRKSSSQAADSAPGIGLGLSLSKRLVHELRGAMQCYPNTPTGLCFEIQFPLTAPKGNLAADDADSRG
jgi:signal transduction histidine kinase